MGRTKKLKLLYGSAILGVVMLMVISLSISMVEAQEGGDPPSIPCSFYGSVTIDGEPAPIGTEITAKRDNKTCGNITVTEEGKYGTMDVGRLGVAGGRADENKIILFYVDGAKADETGIWNSGGVNPLDLSVKKAGGGDSEEGAAGAAIPSKLLIILLIAIVIVAVVIVSVVWRRKNS